MLQSPNAKSCFLLCCLFAEDAEISIEDLTRHCVARSLLPENPRTFDEATDAVNAAIGTLKSSSLLLNGSNENVVRIHDVIRNVGISIALEEKAYLVDHGALRWPSNPIDKPYLAISLRSLKIKRLPDVSKCPQLHTLILDNSELSDLEIPDKFFSGMEKLTVLVLNRMRMKRLPSSLAKLTELRMLCLNECVLEDIAILGDLKTTLEVLSLRGSCINALPREIAQLTSLRVLDLRDCKDLKVIPQGVISNLTGLEELYFPEAFQEWETSNNNVTLEEISNLLRLLFSTGQLTTLHITIPDVMFLPNESLERFKIVVGPREVYSRIHKYSRADLELQGITFKNELIPLVRKAEILYLYKIEALEKVVPLWSFSKLTMLKINDCKIRYLFSESTARGLVHLELLEVAYCNSMEEIVRFERQNDEDELVKFNKLKELNLQALPNLISFYAKMEKMETSSSHAQPLFNEKVIFPVLKELKISTLDNIVEIWDKQPALFNENAEFFPQLEFVRVDVCAKLTSLGPSNMLGRLQNLQELYVSGCPNIESIVFDNGKEEEEVAANSTSVIIPQLKTLQIWKMEKLKSFYSSSKRSNAQSLFNHQVIFPVLEKLNIGELGNTVEIWDKQSPLVHENAKSFSQLVTLEVESCAKLINLVPSNVLRRLLRNLQELNIRSCSNMESIVFENGKEEEATDDSTLVIIPQLRTLYIHDMENLKSFYSSFERSNAQSLFNHQVIFPVLKQLHVSGLGNTIEIWDKQSLLVRENGESFSKLEDVIVENCAKLMNLVPSNILPQLHNLKVKSCPDIESIVYKNGKEEEKVSGASTLVIVSQLRILTIEYMGNLKRFYSSSIRSNAQSLFNHQVIFPVLEQLKVNGLGNIVEIWDKQSLLVHENRESFSKLEDVIVKDCAKLMNLVPSNILPQLHNLKVKSCPDIESIVYENGKEEEKVSGDSTLVIISQLKILTIENMKNLKSFYSSSMRSNAQSLFNHQVIFPVLKQLYIDGLRNIVEIWDKQSLLIHENAESFSKLEDVKVKSCAKLMNLLPSNILPRLQNLRELYVENCPNLESIVFENRKEEEAADDSTLVIIPQLWRLNILGMEKLKSFYSSSKISNAQSLFNHQVIFPALETLSIRKLPNITEIWDKQPLSKPKKETESFCKLRRVDVDNCEQLVYVFPSYMLPQLHILRRLRIRNCKQLEVIVSTELKEKEVANNDVIVFPQLQGVELVDLNKLTSFCFGTQVFFSNKDAFPVLEEINLDENLEFFRNETSTKKEAIEECGTSGKENDHNGEEG